VVDGYIFVLSFALLFAPVTILLTSLNQPRLIGTDFLESLTTIRLEPNISLSKTLRILTDMEGDF
jgi:hypothetical protein